MIRANVTGRLGEIKYPCLMKSSDTDSIVLFIGESKGTVIIKGKHTHSSGVGYYSDAWDDELFEYFSGSITLSNGD